MVTTTQNDLMQRYQRVMFPATSPYFADSPIVVDYAKDQYIYDIDGQQYLDFFGGVLTVSIGHCNDEVTARTIEQLKKTQHTSTLYVNEMMVRVAEKVAELTPGASDVLLHQQRQRSQRNRDYGSANVHGQYRCDCTASCLQWSHHDRNERDSTWYMAFRRGLRWHD